MLDGVGDRRARKTTRAAAARSCLALFAVPTAAGYASRCVELPHAGHAAIIAHRGQPRDTRRLIVGAVAMLCWGFSDSQIQPLSTAYPRGRGSGPEQARAVGFFR